MTETKFVVVDLAEVNGETELADVLNSATKYEVYDTTVGAMAGAEAEFNSHDRFEVWKLTVEKVGP